MNMLVNIIGGIIYVLYKIIHMICSGVWKLITDVMRGIYGKFVALIVGILFIALSGWVISLFQIHSRVEPLSVNNIELWQKPVNELLARPANS
jgi:hypothetical protein